MDIPVVILKDTGSTYGVTVPDIPGCYSWGDTIEDALKNAKEAIVGHVTTAIELGENVDIKPSRIEDLMADPEHAGGIWALVELEPEALDASPERINISIPRFGLRKIDAFLSGRKESRSGFLVRAALKEIAAEEARAA